MIELRPMRSDDPVAASLLDEYVTFRTDAFPGPTAYTPASPDPLAFVGGGLFLVAFVDGIPSGCGGVRALTDTRFEIKHLFVRPVAQGQGIGRSVLGALEAHARSRGARELVLDTHSSLTAAAALYDSCGFTEIEPYNENPNANRWYLKKLA